jgi:RNA polymerase sigma factor (sigma-70 family)
MEAETGGGAVIDLVASAQAGDGEAFRELTEPYRRELQVHCYRMLGSLHDAEDALQDTLLAAWQGIGRFEGRASIRTWLYRIATNRCLNARRSASRRPARWDMPGVDVPEPTRLGEVGWLEPYPDVLLEGAMPLGPEARYEQTEAISLAFVTVLQVLPPRQVAVLVLRDVLGFHASEVAEMLDSTVDSVNSALKRARAGLRHLPSEPSEPSEREPAPGSTSEQALVERFVRAYESGEPTRSSPCSPTTSSSPCRRSRSSTRGATRRPACSPTSSVRVGEWTWCRRVPTASPRSARTCVRPPGSARERVCSSSPLPATGSAPSPASRAPCSRGSGCLTRFPNGSAALMRGSCGEALR